MIHCMISGLAKCAMEAKSKSSIGSDSAINVLKKLLVFSSNPPLSLKTAPKDCLDSASTSSNLNTNAQRLS